MPDDDLPEFESPPLAEVVLGIQFDPLAKVRAAHLGALWDLFREEFPHTEDHPSLPPVFERFSPEAVGEAGLGLEFLSKERLPRSWFINEAGDQLLQFQEDRFLHNWRRVGASRPYPRYSILRRRFEGEARRLEEFVVAQGLGALTPNQCEVTYINHVVAGENWSEHHQAGTVFRQMGGAAADTLKTKPEHLRFEAGFVIADGDGDPRGRLHTSIASGFLRDGAKPMFAMTLTARGAPTGEGLAGAFRFLDLGHRWIVRSFAELTTEEMHAVWRRKR